MSQGDKSRPDIKWGMGSRDNSKNTKKQENRIARAISGRRLPGSGNQTLARAQRGVITAGGDVETTELLVEHKRTKHKSISLKQDWLRKVREGARIARKDPALIITFEGVVTNEDWIVLPLEVWQRLAGVDE